MFYPQGNYHPQGNFGTQGNFYPQSGFGTQGNFYPQSGFGAQGNFYPQGVHPQGAFGPQGYQGHVGGSPFANTLYGVPLQPPGFGPTPGFAQGLPQLPNWQHPVQQQAALQQHAIQQLLAQQLAAQQQALQQPSGVNGFGGLSNGAAQAASVWPQHQANPERINPALQQQPQQPHLLQQLAQYHYLVAQQLAQLAAQQAVQSPYPYTGQFIPGQLSANFAPGATMH